VRSVVFLPVWNQAREFPRVLDELRANRDAADTFLLVNDGSDDGSERIVRGSGFPHIDAPRHMGIGHSYLLALEWALRERYALFGVMASNGKMLASEVPRLLEPLRRAEADYVTGSRFLEGGASPNLPGFRRHAIPMVNVFVWGLTGARLTDATCGFRAFRLELMRRARFDWHAPWLYTYGLEYYIYAKVILDGRLRWKEVPCTMRYPAKGQPYSKIRPFTGWWAMLRPWVVARIDRRGFGPS
jgi:glycosyltransferase involved in cell wall biosynthesis